MADSAYHAGSWRLATRALTDTLLGSSGRWARRVQDIAQARAPWTDRGGRDSLTGKSARDSLEGEAALSGDGREIIVVLRSTRASTRSWRGGPNAPVGAFLELGTRRMHRKFEIIRPTLESDLDAYHALLQVAMQGDGNNISFGR